MNYIVSCEMICNLYMFVQSLHFSQLVQLSPSTVEINMLMHIFGIENLPLYETISRLIKKKKKNYHVLCILLITHTFSILRKLEYKISAYKIDKGL